METPLTQILAARRPLLRAIVLLCATLMFASVATADPPQLKIKGLTRSAAQNLRVHLGALGDELSRSTLRSRRMIDKAVHDALQPFGYYAAQYSLEQENAVLTLTVERGPRVLFIAPDIRIGTSADTLPAIEKMVREAPFAPGMPLLHGRYDDFRDDLLQTCRRLGFFEARYTRSELRVDPERLEAQVRLELESGPRYSFAETRISGTRVNTALLDMLAEFHSGDPFNRELVTRFERRLRDTGYFRELVLKVEREPEARARVIVLAQDNDKTRYDVGAGFSTDSSLRLRFNRHTPLVNSAGHSLSIDSEISEPRQTVEGLYRIPHHDPLDDILEITAGLQGKRIEDTDSKVATMGVRHALKLFGEWSYNYGVSAEFERYTVGSESEKDVAYLLPATSISRTRLDPGIDPMRGYSYWSSLDFSTRELGASADFTRWRGSAKWLFKLPDDNTTVLSRVELGAIWTDGFNQIPASLRFAAGGDNSIRGYDLDSLGPRDDNGKLTGGRYLSVGSVEISRRVLPTWRIAAFVDGGSAFNEKHDKFYQSAGLGVRWLSPVGQVRVDVAMPIQDRENSGFRLHISMGPPL